MNLLVIGGTRFLGRRIVESALASGHSITLFNRGKDGADLFPGQVERVVGDRDGGLGVLRGRTWDAVIDTPGYFPRVVADSSRFLNGSVGRYLFISTISVYDPEPGAITINEDTRKATLEDPTVEEITNETYGGLKVLCEQEVEEVYGERALILRPGYIVGSYDTSDRFTYWAMRLTRGGRMLAGGRPEAPIQIIDAHDIGSFSVRLLEQGASGPFNVCGPQTRLSWVEMLERGKSALETDAELVWVDAKKLEEIGAEPGNDMPLYQGRDALGDAFMSAENSRSVAAGLTFTALEETFRDTAAWASGQTEPLKVGMSEDRERELLDQALK
jgi:2'-hydroxyisoflavone reductase